ncbi:MAG: hypothetical protein K0R72_389 [Clostridia bacterium]|jgi:hypothetical protein|nr:hypothetical protein [Clostridia bacterium]
MKNCSNDSASFILYAVLISIALAKNLEPAEQNLLGIFLQEVGGNLSSMAAFEKFCEDVEGSSYGSIVGPIVK